MTARTKVLTVFEPVEGSIETKAVKFETSTKIGCKISADDLDGLVNALHNEESNLRI
jgi:hypothetical protein